MTKRQPAGTGRRSRGAFGTGFASLSQLRRLPFDKLKIDREFVSEVHTRTESQAIRAALIALAGCLGIDAVAEGTEEADEIRRLHGHGCRLFQSFGFARPMDAAVYAACIRSGEIAEKSDSFRVRNAAA